MRPHGHPPASDPVASPRPLPLVIAAVLTTLVALWLLGVTTWVLPARDPAHVGMWRGVALVDLAFAGLTFAYLLAGGRDRGPRGALRLAAAAAVGMGAFLMVEALRPRGHFEGYLLLMGALLAAHGLAGLADAGLTGSGGRPTRPS